MRCSFSGGVYGAEYALQLTATDGQNVTVRGSRAFALHSELFRRPKGPERQERMRELFDVLAAEK